MVDRTVHITGLRLRSAQVVEEVPDLTKGSVLTTLDEFQDIKAIIAEVKKQGGVPAEKWLVFDLDKIHKKNSKLKTTKNLMAMFGNKVRDIIKEKGIERFVHLEKRGGTFYLVGGPSVNVK